MPDAYSTLDFTDTFLATFAGKNFAASERKAFLKALRLLDDDERHRSLRAHQLKGDREGSWSVSASDVLRMTFKRRPDGRKRMLTCSRRVVSNARIRPVDEKSESA